MAKVVLQKPTSGFNLAAINDNFIKLEDELNNKILYRNNPQTEPNQLLTDVDVNSVRLYNLREPLTPNEAARLQDVTNAISGNTSANLISFTPFSTIGSTNVQAAIQELLTEISSGSAVLPVTTSYPSVTLNAATPNGRIEFPTSNPSGFNVNAGTFTLDFEFNSNNYFLHNPGSHVAFVLRQDPATFATSVTGNGAIMGNLTWPGFAGDEALYTPVMMLETWDPLKIPTQRWIFPDTTTPRNKLLQDNQQYKVSIQSTKAYNGDKFIRYKLWKYSGPSTKYWELQNDTGHVLDHNTGADFTKSAFMIGVVFLDNLGAWDIEFDNIKGTWGPPEATDTDTTAKASKYSPDINGDLTFIKTGSRIKAPVGTGPSLESFLTVQSDTANSNTSFVLKPNGSGNSSSILLSNNSTSNTVYQVLSLKTEASKAVIETFNRGSVDPTIDINIGAGLTVANFGPQGLSFAGASKYIGTNRINTGTAFNFGSASSSSWAAASNLNWETYTVDGGISGFIGGSYNPALIELAILPTARMVSMLIRDLKDKKII